MHIETDIVTEGAAVCLNVQVGRCIERERADLIDHILTDLKRCCMDGPIHTRVLAGCKPWARSVRSVWCVICLTVPGHPL